MNPPTPDSGAPDRVDASISHVKSFWDDYATYFRFWNESRFYRRLLDQTMAAVSPKKAQFCLDLGCGTGTCAVRLAKAGASVVALDISEAMLEEAKRYSRQVCSPEEADRICFLQCEAKTYLASSSSNRFDQVVASLFVCYLPNYEDVLRECHRVLKPEGVLVMSNPVPNFAITRIFLSSFFDVCRDLPLFLPAAFRLLRYVLQIRKFGRIGLFHFFTPEETARVLLRCGFGQSGITIKHVFCGQVLLTKALK